MIFGTHLVLGVPRRSILVDVNWSTDRDVAFGLSSPGSVARSSLVVEILIIFFIGLAAGFGAREMISRRRRRSDRPWKAYR